MSNANPRIVALEALYAALDTARDEWPELSIDVSFVGGRPTQPPRAALDETARRLSKHAKPRPRRPMSEKGRRSIRRRMRARWKVAKAAGRNHI